MAPSTTQKYKIKLVNGRIVGPIDIERVRLLVMEDQIRGQELAREYPKGDWVNINLIGPIADLLVARAQGGIGSHDSSQSGIVLPSGQASIQIERFGERNAGTTRMLPQEPEISLETVIEPRTDGKSSEPDNEPTQLVVRGDQLASKRRTPGTTVYAALTADEISSSLQVAESTATGKFSDQQTIMIQNPLASQNWSASDAIRDPRKLPGFIHGKVKKINSGIWNSLVTGAVVYIIFQLVSTTDPGSAVKEPAWVPFRPSLPSYTNEKPDPAKSNRLYMDAIKYYLMDTVPGYKTAADKFSAAIRYDNQNVKAEALLASSYINLIDSSNKDENYFSVISKLIDLSRAKDVDLPETVIADVEFYIVTNKPGAAQNRIVDYTRTRPHFGPEMFYYLALAFYHRGDLTNANHFINEYRATPFSAKLYYLRGRIAEKLGDPDSAIQEYTKAVAFNSRHAKSRLAIARILAAKGRIQEAANQLEFLTSGRYRPPKEGPILEKTNPDGTLDNRLLLAPQELALAYYLHAQLSQLHDQSALALAQMERAIKLDPDNHDLLLEYYSLRAKMGEKLSKIQPEARMYYFLGEGEKFVKAGDYHSALSQFLLAREQLPKSPLPLVKIGDMFSRIHDLTNARANYKLAADRAPRSIEVWTKYINTLIQSYEWDDAKNAMDRFRKLPVPQSAIDKAAADMYMKQGRYTEAQDLYRKAMRRDTIDSSVYIAYAKSLMATRNYKEAPFFFALALRFDPLNIDAISGTAKCIAATESIDRAINYLQDELQKGSAPNAELNAAIADLQIQKGAWTAAEQFVNQAIQSNPDYAFPYYLQAQIYLNRENTQKDALDRALEAFNSYSDRNQSDPIGYLERYRIFVKKGQYDKADEELGKVFAIYPKYPNLHYYKGALYSIMGSHRAAIEQFGTELKLNPTSASTLLALGKEYALMGGATEALTLFQKAMQLSPTSSEAKAEAANANFMLKNYQGAIALYMAAIAIDRGNANLYKRLGMVYREVGDSGNASAAFRQYLEMEPDAPDRAEIERYR